MARNKYGMQKIVQNDLQQCINSFRRMKKGGIGIADECVEQTCKNALKYINELEAKLENYVEVVRCKNCKYNVTNNCPTFNEAFDGKDWQTLENNDYCSYGEKYSILEPITNHGTRPKRPTISPFAEMSEVHTAHLQKSGVTVKSADCDGCKKCVAYCANCNRRKTEVKIK